MRKFMKFSATFYLVGIPIILIFMLFLPGFGFSGSWFLTVLVFAGYFFLLKYLGAWSSQEAWEEMGGGRKFALFLVALPVILGTLEIAIFLAIFGVFREANASLRNAEMSYNLSQIQSELDRLDRM